MNDIRPKQGYGFIYMYTSPSGKSYIGQTRCSLLRRAGGKDGKGYLGCHEFYQAIQKYGFENFDLTILAEVKIEQLDDMEVKYIHLFNTLMPNGYNMTLGGHEYGYTEKKTKPVYQYDLQTGELLNEYKSYIEAERATGCSHPNILACINGERRTCGGFFWSRVKMKKYPINDYVISNKAKQVEMYDLEGNFLRSFPSLRQAADFVNGSGAPIKNCCLGNQPSSYGYIWRCTEFVATKKYNNSAKSVMKLDKDTNEVLQVYPSISAASKEFTNNGTSGIRRALDRDNRTAYGYKWKTAQGTETTDS